MSVDQEKKTWQKKVLHDMIRIGVLDPVEGNRCRISSLFEEHVETLTKQRGAFILASVEAHHKRPVGTYELMVAIHVWAILDFARRIIPENDLYGMVEALQCMKKPMWDEIRQVDKVTFS